MTYSRDYYQKNKAKYAARYQQKKEELLEYQKNYYQDHKEERIEYQHSYTEVHKDEIRESKKSYYETVMKVKKRCPSCRKQLQFNKYYADFYPVIHCKHCGTPIKVGWTLGDNPNSDNVGGIRLKVVA